MIEHVAVDDAPAQLVRLDFFDWHLRLACSLGIRLAKYKHSGANDSTIAGSSFDTLKHWWRSAMTTFYGALTRRKLLHVGLAALAAAPLGSWGRAASAAPVNIRYATGGGIGPNEMETII